MNCLIITYNLFVLILSSILVVEFSKTRPKFRSKTRVIKGFQVYIQYHRLLASQVESWLPKIMATQDQ